MSKINWKVRIKNKYFWLTFISALALFSQNIMELFGVNIDVLALGDQVSSIVEAIFMILAIVGIVNDPTTAGLTDSSQALTYEKPKNY